MVTDDEEDELIQVEEVKEGTGDSVSVNEDFNKVSF